MNVFDCIELVIANDGLGRSTVEAVPNFARRSSFLAGTIEELSGDVAERPFGGRAFLALLGKRRFHAQRVAKRLIFVW
jgi:hypothetical protein